MLHVVELEYNAWIQIDHFVDLIDIISLDKFEEQSDITALKGLFWKECKVTQQARPNMHLVLEDFKLLQEVSAEFAKVFLNLCFLLLRLFGLIVKNILILDFLPLAQILVMNVLSLLIEKMLLFLHPLL